MGEPKFSRPKFDTPSHPWKAARIEEEHAIKAQHGLKNMREIWKAKSQLRRHRRQAMRLIGMVDTSEGHGKKEMRRILVIAPPPDVTVAWAHGRRERHCLRRGVVFSCCAVPSNLCYLHPEADHRQRLLFP